LDYQLDGPGGDGSKAIDIIKTVSTNSHFNLIVVHTNETLSKAFEEILISQLIPHKKRPSDELLAETSELIFEAEAEHENLTNRLKESVQLAQYLAYVADEREACKAAVNGQGPFAAFHSVFNSVAAWRRDKLVKVLTWCLCTFEGSIAEAMQKDGSSNPRFSASEPFWIRSGTAFIAFTAKKGGATILGDLLIALTNWKPEPSRLFLAKLRSHVDEMGVVAENSVMDSQYVLARWYEQLLNEDKETRRSLISESIDRHTEQLVANIRHEVEHFANRLVEADVERVKNKIDVIQEYFKIDLNNVEKRQRAERDHNIFINSKKPSGWHLNTGHIFESDGQTWICLSPACDLVPRPRATQEDIGEDSTAFIAVKLFDRGDGLVPPSDIQQNRYVFVKIDGVEKLFAFNKDPTAGPYWCAMYAHNSGKLGEGMTFEFSRMRLAEKRLVASVSSAKIVGQLRYEYALNLVQKLGVSFTRVGLDFSG
jgi:F0F1-type ATP synthase membrane subunit b/b'